MPEAEKGQSRDKAATKLGIKGMTAEKLEKVVDAADSGNPQARKALDAVNSGDMSADAAYRVVHAPKESVKSSPGIDPRVDPQFISSDVNHLFQRIESLKRRTQDGGRINNAITLAASLEKAAAELTNIAKTLRGGSSTVERPVQQEDSGSIPSPSLQIVGSKHNPMHARGVHGSR